MAKAYLDLPPTASGISTVGQLGRYLAHQIMFSAALEDLLVPDDSREQLVKGYLSCPDSVLRYSFASLRWGSPTAYIFSRGSNTGRIFGRYRFPYLKRHIGIFKEYSALVQQKGYPDGTDGASKQLLWIFIEDDLTIDPAIANMLDQSGLRK